MTEPTLKPCPFCGSYPVAESENGFQSVGCRHCADNDISVRIVKFGKPEAVHDAWNSRPGDKKLEDEIEQLNSEIGFLQQANKVSLDKIIEYEARANSFFQQQQTLMGNYKMLRLENERIKKGEESLSNKPEPEPIQNSHPAVWDLVVADMRERDQMGEKKYGTRLQPFNGRNSLVDAYQESLDLAVYLRQTLYELEALRAKNERLRAGIEEVLIQTPGQDAMRSFAFTALSMLLEETR